MIHNKNLSVDNPAMTAKFVPIAVHYMSYFECLSY